MLFNSQISQTQASEIYSGLSVSSEDHCLDVVRGKGEFLIQLIETMGASGLGTDCDEQLVAALMLLRKEAE